MSPQTVTGHLTGCMFFSSIKIARARVHNFATGLSGINSHLYNVSIHESNSFTLTSKRALFVPF